MILRFLETTDPWVQNYSNQEEINSSQLPILEPVLKPAFPSYTIYSNSPPRPSLEIIPCIFIPEYVSWRVFLTESNVFFGTLQQFLSVVGKCFYILDRIHLSCNIIAFHSNFYQGRNVLRRNRLRISIQRQLH